MAIVNVAERGAVSLKAAGASVSVPVNANMVVGRLAVARASWDNADTVSGETTRLSIADAAGNVWTKIAEYTETAGGVADGLTTALFACILTSQINSGANVTASNTDTARVSKALSVREYTIGASSFAVEDYDAGGGLGGGAFARVLASMTSRAYLLEGVYSFERGDHGSLNFTQDADYLDVGFVSTIGGGANTNLSLFGGYRLAPLTGDTWGISVGSATGEFSGILAAIYEAASGTEYVDSDTALLLFTPSGIEFREITEEGTVVIKLTPSGSELAESVDTTEVYVELTPSGVELREIEDTEQLYLDLEPSGTELRETEDAESIYLGLVPSGNEFIGGGTEDTGELYLKLLPSGSDTHEAADEDAVYLDLQASGTEERETTDSDTVPLGLQPGSTDISTYTDAAETYLALTPSGTETLGGQFLDAETIYVTFTPFGTEEIGTEDGDIALLGLTPSGTEYGEVVDTDIASLIFTPSGTETTELHDVGTVNFILTPSGDDQLVSVGSDAGELYLKLTVSGSELRITLDYQLVGRLARRWGAQSLARVYEGRLVRHWRGRLQ